MNFNRDLIRKFDKCDSQQKRLYLADIHKKYHIQKHIRKPLLAVDELAFRIIFETLSGRITYRMATTTEWQNRNIRDEGHNKRMRRLISCVKKSKLAQEYIRTFGWLRI